jgi:cation diffusion facilitator family transporter
MGIESIHRILSPEAIHFDEAIGIAVVGLAVNVVSAWILEGGSDHREHHSDHDGKHYHHDHNLRSAYVHVLADALTSILAIAALSLGKYFSLNWMDPAMGIVGSLVIVKWAYSLCKETASELLDVHSKKAHPECCCV